MSSAGDHVGGEVGPADVETEHLQPGDVRRRRWRDRLTSFEVAAVAGVVCAVAWSVSLRGLLGAPGLQATEEELVRHYAEVGAGSTACLPGAHGAGHRRLPVVRGRDPPPTG